MRSERERRVPTVDVLESCVLGVVPALFVGTVATVFGGDGRFVPGFCVGGLFGAVLVSYRRVFYAIRTENGIERRRRTYSDDPAKNVWVRLSSIDYDGKYDRIVGTVLALVGIGAFAAIPLTHPDGPTVIRLILLGLFGITTALVAIGSSQR